MNHSYLQGAYNLRDRGGSAHEQVRPVGATLNSRMKKDYDKKHCLMTSLSFSPVSLSLNYLCDVQVHWLFTSSWFLLYSMGETFPLWWPRNLLVKFELHSSFLSSVTMANSSFNWTAAAPPLMTFQTEDNSWLRCLTVQWLASALFTLVGFTQIRYMYMYLHYDHVQCRSLAWRLDEHSIKILKQCYFPSKKVGSFLMLFSIKPHDQAIKWEWVNIILFILSFISRILMTQ